MLSKSAAIQLVGDQLFKQFTAERERLKIIDEWARGKQPDPWKPRTANNEHDALMRKSFTPMLGLVVSALSQASYVDGYRSPKAADDAPSWAIWQANGFDSRQVAVHRGAFSHGLAYVTVMPGELNGERMPVCRGVSARKMIAVYRDAAEDEWPEYALRGEKSGDKWMLRLYDEDVVHRLSIDDLGGELEYITYDEHEMGVPPVVRVPNTLDLDGRAVGEVEPFIPVAARYDQSTWDRMMVQRYASWKIRYATGMAKPETEAGKQAQKLKLAQDDILMAENPATKFGTLDETTLDGFIAAAESDVQTLAAVSQTPPQYLNGDMTNLSADALAMAEATLMRKAAERHTVIGEAHEQWLRLAGSWMGVDVDPGAQVKWRDVESRSLAQVADALGKIADQLHFPAQLLWEKIPGFTQTDIEQAQRLAERGDSLQQLMDTLERQADGGDGAGDS